MATPNVTNRPPVPAGGMPPARDSTFTRNLRYEWADEEGRAIIGSWAIAIALGVIWLLLVFFGPRRGPDLQLLNPAETAPITLNLEPPEPVTPVPAPGAAVEVPAPGPTTAPRGQRGP